MMLQRRALTFLKFAFGRSDKYLSPTCSRVFKNRHFCAPAPKPIVADTLDAVTRLELRVNRWPHTLGLSYLWLRDHCQCSDCYNHLTHQRKFDIQNIPLNIRPAVIKTTEEGLELQWPDGHESKYEYKFLWQNIFEAQRTSQKDPQRPWNAATFPKSGLTTVPLSEIQDPKKEGMKRLVSSIITHGIGFITEVTPDVESTRAVVEEIGDVRETLFGKMWSFQDNYKHADTAYTNEYLGPHTDTTYFSEASRIQVFHCLQQAPEGGETLLMDGFNIAEQYRNRHPEGYDFLSSTAIPSQYIGDGHHFQALDTIFKHNPATGKLQQFRYNIYDRAPLVSIPVEKMQEFYLHMRNLTKLIRNPKNEYWHKLEPGTLLFIDNWRVMHGRNTYSGPRIMGGCYLSNDAFTSKARTLGVQL